MLLEGKKILIGVTASIAAYKIALLVRLFIKQKAEVRVVITKKAKQFVTPLTLATLSKNPVLDSFSKKKKHTTDWNNHIDLSLWADIFLIAPATANTISKMVSGSCDNLLMGIYLSAKCPVYIAPAMDLDMYKHASTTKNIALLEERLHTIIPPEEGELASNLYGKGRMAEPENIIQFINQDIAKSLPLTGKTYLITAGPTQEAIDPVRYISNYSSGKMGYALAQKVLQRGAKVILISGPTTEKMPSHPHLSLQKVISAEQMFNAVNQHFKNCDVAIFTAAVSDYKPCISASKKIKKTDGLKSIPIEKTKDILQYFGKNKEKQQVVVGFALETENEIENATKKLHHKNADIIVLNSLKDKGAGFGKQTNKISIISSDKPIIHFELKPKTVVAGDILDVIANKSQIH